MFKSKIKFLIKSSAHAGRVLNNSPAKSIFLFGLFLLICDLWDANVGRIYEYLTFTIGALLEPNTPINQHFPKTVYRLILSIGIVLIFYTFTTSIKGRSDLKNFMSMSFATVMYFICFFIYLKIGTESFGFIPYDFLSYLALIALVLRENIVFTSQFFFTNRPKIFAFISFVSLVAFVLLHPLDFSFPRTLATLMMINVWFYTISKKNIWLGVFFHLLWNLTPWNPWLHLSFYLFTFIAIARIKDFSQEAEWCLSYISNFKFLRKTGFILRTIALSPEMIFSMLKRP